MTIDKVIAFLVDEKIISKRVGKIALNSNDGYAYENILTDDNGEPTEFLQELIFLTGHKITVDENNEVVFILSEIK